MKEGASYVDRLATAVPAAVVAHDVGHLGPAALRAHAARRRFELPRRRPPAAGLRFAGLLLGDCHVFALSSARRARGGRPIEDPVRRPRDRSRRYFCRPHTRDTTPGNPPHTAAPEAIPG